MVHDDDRLDRPACISLESAKASENMFMKWQLACVVLAAMAGWCSAAETVADVDAVIRDLRIKAPDAKPYVTLREWIREMPSLPDDVPAEHRAIVLRAWATLWLNTQPAEGAWWIHPIISPGEQYMRGIWIWDTAYHVLGLAYGGPKARQLALWQIEVMLHGQHESGKFPREIWKQGPQYVGRHGIQSPGMMTMAANRLFDAATTETEKDAVRKAMAGFYPRFVRNHEWYFAHTKTDRGLCAWIGLDAGWDTSPRWDTAYEALDLNCYLYLDRVELAKMANILGRHEESRQWAVKADELRDAIRKLHWNSALGVYNDTQKGQGTSDFITPVIFWPMWTGVATEEQGIGAVKYLGDPKCLAATWPLPSVALSHSTFRPKDYWRGPTWINLNWTAIRGLHRCGLEKEAADLREKTLKLVGRTPVFYEYYDPQTGEGLGSANYGWTAALCIDLILSPDAAARPILSKRHQRLPTQKAEGK
jgi:putative isomerase